MTTSESSVTSYMITKAEKKISHTIQLLSIIDKNKEKLNNADYIDICNHLKYLKIEEDKINKVNLYKIKYLKQYVITNCMEKGLSLGTRIKVCNVIIEPETYSQIQKLTDIQMFNCLIINKPDNTKILRPDDGFVYTICEEDDDNINLIYRKIILLKIDIL